MKQTHRRLLLAALRPVQSSAPRSGACTEPLAKEPRGAQRQELPGEMFRERRKTSGKAQSGVALGTAAMRSFGRKPSVCLSVILLVSCAAADRQMIRSQIAASPIPEGRSPQMDVAECQEVAKRAQDTFARSGANRDEALDFYVLAARNCLANRGYALRPCRRTFTSRAECEGVGLPDD